MQHARNNPYRVSHSHLRHLWQRHLRRSYTYPYDVASNLICADCGTSNEIDYAYDGNNRRVSRTKGSVTLISCTRPMVT